VHWNGYSVEIVRITFWPRVLALERRSEYTEMYPAKGAAQVAAPFFMPSPYVNKKQERRSTMNELVRRVGGVAVTREATEAVAYVDAVAVVEAAAVRSTRRVGDLAINDIDYLKMRQREIEQRNPDAAEMVAAVVNGINVAIVHRVRRYAIEMGG
jgi:hypothetical protein